MNLSRNRIGIIIGVIFLVIGIFLIAQFVKIGPGVPPAQYLPRLLIPEGDISSMNCSGYAGSSGTKYFTRLGQIRDDNPQHFPHLSDYSSYRMYRSERTNATVMIAVWYFSSDADFSVAKKKLSGYLQQNGTVASRELVLENSVGDTCSGLTKDSGTSGPSRVTAIQVTSFSGTSGSGVFFTSSRPLISSRDDFFIQYYGTAGDSNKPGDTAEIVDLINLNERPYHLKGKIGPLA